MKLNTITESLERKYLSERVNHENDEVNKVLRRVRKQGIKSISDEDKEFLAQNGIQIRPDWSSSSNARPYFRGKGREFKAYRNWEDDGDSRSLTYRSKSIDGPDFSNRKLDVKGWLDKQDSAPRERWEDNSKSKQARWALHSAHKREADARQHRLENEANIANRLEDEDIYTNREDSYKPYPWLHNRYDWWVGGDFDYMDGQETRDNIARAAGKHKRREYATYDESLKKD